MAITETRQYREPFVEAAGLGVTNEGLRLLGQTLPTSTSVSYTHLTLPTNREV